MKKIILTISIALVIASCSRNDNSVYPIIPDSPTPSEEPVSPQDENNPNSEENDPSQDENNPSQDENNPSQDENNPSQDENTPSEEPTPEEPDDNADAKIPGVFDEEHYLGDLVGGTYDQMTLAFGAPIMEDGNTYGYSLSGDPYIFSINFTFNATTNLIDRISVAYKSAAIEKDDIKAYLESHYYFYREVTTRIYYTSEKTLDESSIIFSYDTNTSWIYYENADLRKK